MEEINKKLDLILSSQLVMQTEVIRLNFKIDNLDEKVNKRIDDLDQKVNKKIDNLDQKFEQRFDELEETLEQDRQDIANIFNDILKKIPA